MTPPEVNSMTAPHPELATATIAELAARLHSGDVSALELTEAYLARIEALDPGCNAFLTVTAEQALHQASECDRKRASGAELGPLHGIPFAAKDNMDTAGVRTTSGMSVLDQWHPRADAAPVRAARSAGAVLLGKTNMHEGSFGITSANPHYGPVRNPHDSERIAGGSSGGSAAAVASGMVPAALGTDTGGSLRIPAALCGVVGFRPTMGIVDGTGVTRLSWSFDTSGPIARTVADAGLLFAVLAGRIADPVAARPDTLRGLRIGVPRGYFATDNDPEIDRITESAAARLAEHGARLVPCTVEGIEHGSDIGFRMVGPEKVVLTKEYFAKVEPSIVLEEVLDRFGEDLRATFASEIGPDANPVPAHVYLDTARRDTARIKAGIEEALREVDVLLTPTTPAPAIPLAEHQKMLLNGREQHTFETFIRYTFGTAVAGIPGISIPAGHTGSGLPVGVQLLGRAHTDQRLLAIAAAASAALED
ncbi:amidase [Sciscionella sediminilitoris]|uniref:amidase n=1 Tax=Sciscionella sediminilitoris TaxID=1445613 RepID=UPI00069134F5|nr:amidase family protein [Sciscionella sp. SE31]